MCKYYSEILFIVPLHLIEKNAPLITMTLLPQTTGNSKQGEYFPSLSVKGLSNLPESSYEHYGNTLQWPRKGKIPQLPLSSPCFCESQGRAGAHSKLTPNQPPVFHTISNTGHKS